MTPGQYVAIFAAVMFVLWFAAIIEIARDAGRTWLVVVLLAIIMLVAAAWCLFAGWT